MLADYMLIAVLIICASTLSVLGAAILVEPKVRK